MAVIVRHRETGEEFVFLGSGVMKECDFLSEKVVILAPLDKITNYLVYPTFEFGYLFETIDSKEKGYLDE